MEKLVRLIDEYCSFPVIEKAKLFKRVLFNFLSPVINATSKQDKTIPLPLHSFVDKQSAKAAFGVISVDFRVA